MENSAAFACICLKKHGERLSVYFRTDLPATLIGKYSDERKEFSISKEMIKMDLEYAEKRSLALDLRILLRTILMVVQRRNAY